MLMKNTRTDSISHFPAGRTRKDIFSRDVEVLPLVGVEAG